MIKSTLILIQMLFINSSVLASFKTNIERVNIMTQSSTSIYTLDSELRLLEKEQLQSFLPQVIQKAKEVGSHYCEGFSLPAFISREQALEYRYLHVPILYKLGMTKEASLLAQATFEYLFPELHQAIEKRVKELFGQDYLNTCKNLIEDFLNQDGQISSISYRIKSTHSIWKKIPSLEIFEQMGKEQFAACVDDFIGICWKMKIPEGGNRYDALIEGVRLAPLKNVKSFRNQQLPQKSGFDSEPVIKLCYVINGIPIELQFLGGDILAYMSAKGYAVYKTQLSFSPQKNEVSDDEWCRRLSMAIKLGEYKQQIAFRRYMFAELIGEIPNYSEYTPFILDDAPKLEKNKILRFSNSLKPICELSSLVFKEESHLLF